MRVSPPPVRRVPAVRWTIGPALLVIGALVVAWLAPAAGAEGTPAVPGVVPFIVNGTVTTEHPSTGALLVFDDASHSTINTFCSGTLIGCQTFLTAAHCVCPDNANDAVTCERRGLSAPSILQVFLQHAGVFDVTAVTIDPDFVFGQGADLAMITLSEPVTGIAPSAINTQQRAAAGTAGTVVGFGTTTAARTATDDSGIKRDGAIVVGLCTDGVPSATNVCWTFNGVGANTCEGDSGGPLFVDFGRGEVLAGVTSGGGSPSCLAPDLPFDTDVFVYAPWIAAQAAGGVSTTPCGSLPPVGSAAASVAGSGGQLNATQQQAHWDVSVPAGTSTLRIALNGVPWSGSGDQTTNDFNLYVRAGDAPTTSVYDCRDLGPTPSGVCEINAPAAGTWGVLVTRVSGSGAFQLTATTFARSAANACRGDCNDDGVVTVDELVTGVDIALGTLDVAACPAGDGDGDGTISVDELVSAVDRALNGC